MHARVPYVYGKTHTASIVEAPLQFHNTEPKGLEKTPLKTRMKKHERLDRSERTFTARRDTEAKARKAFKRWKKWVRKNINSPTIKVHKQYQDGDEFVIMAEFWHHSA